MKKAIFTFLAFHFFSIFCLAQTGVVISEIMYDNPATDNYEYVELYNNGSNTVNISGWSLGTALTYTFPQSVSLLSGDYIIVAKDSALFESAFGVAAFQWGVAGGALNNTGETIKLLNSSSILVDSVHYSATAPWPAAANGQGPSLVLCDPDGDNNDPANWAAANTATGFTPPGSTIEVLANPGGDSECPTSPVVTFVLTPSLPPFLENAGSAFISVAISGGTGSPTSVTVQASAASTATAGADHDFTAPLTLTFPGGTAAQTQMFTVNLADDGDIEPTETLVLNLTNPTNGATIAPNGGEVTVSIVDNDGALTNALVITGAFDTQVTPTGGTWAKGVELRATQDIPNLAVFGVTSVNNGGGSTGIVEVMLPAVPASAGQCIYVTNDSLLFLDFFGNPGIIVASGAANVNGDDAFELYENNIVIDVFGEVSYPAGSTLPWNYLDGWAYRNSGTGPDGSIFQLDNWTFSGIDVFDGVANNASAPSPFPTCTWSNVPPTTAIANDDNASTTLNTAVTISILGNDVLPLALTSLSVTVQPNTGTAVANGLTSITYTPDPDFCGTDVFKYQICDAMGCDDAIVLVAVECPADYPPYDIATVTSVDAAGLPDSLDVTCQLQGIVHGIDFQGNANIQFALIDQSGGISVFSVSNFGYTVQEGDELQVRGKIELFNCLTQIRLDTLFLLSTGNPLVTPELTTFLDESFESELLRINNLTLVDPAQWTGAVPGFNVQVTNGASTNTMRIDNDCELYAMPAPAGPFHAIGLGGQFDTAPCDVGYQFLPRYAADLILLNSADEELARKIQVHPNPVGYRLHIRSEVKVDAVSVANLLGQCVLEVKNPGGEIEVGGLEAGLYLVTFRVKEAAWTAKFVKE